MEEFDCILIPGGGLLNDGSLPPWTIARLDYALPQKDQCRWFFIVWRHRPQTSAAKFKWVSNS